MPKDTHHPLVNLLRDVPVFLLSLIHRVSFWKMLHFFVRCQVGVRVELQLDEDVAVHFRTA